MIGTTLRENEILTVKRCGHLYIYRKQIPMSDRHLYIFILYFLYHLDFLGIMGWTSQNNDIALLTKVFDDYNKHLAVQIWTL